MTQVCPVCKGVGLVGHNFYDLNPNRVTFNKLPNRIPCRACGGVGIITDFPNSRIADIAKLEEQSLEEQLKARANLVNELQRQLSLKDEIIDDKTDFEDKQRAQIKVLTESLTELVHLHGCEQEGLQSGRPTPEQWFNAINKAHDALWPKSTDKP